MLGRVVVWLALVAVAGIILSKTRSVRPPKGYREVPGPKGLPLIGNILQVPIQPRHQLISWAQQYGELFRLRLGRYNWVFLNHPAAIKEIMDRQAASTSGRVPTPVLSELVSGGRRFLLMGNTPTWRKLRGLVHKLLTPRMSEKFRPSQDFEAKQLIYDLCNSNLDDKEFYNHIRRYTTSVVLTSTYGKRVPTSDNPDIVEVYGIMKDFSDTTVPGAFWADVFPPLAKLPTALQSWRKRALQYQERQTRAWMKFWNDLKIQIDLGKAPECFVKQWLETDWEKQEISELQAAYVAGTMIEAGSETTSSALNSCVKYLAAYPHVQERANEEISRVVGDARSPTWEDEEKLPYIRAMVKEILRLRPVSSLGQPHMTTADVYYKDYFIPKGTVLALCQYAVHYDPARYQDPFEFRPERYLNHPLKAGAYAGGDPFARDHFGFGAGRRICPGMHLAENSLFITLAKIIWAFDIRPPLDAEGREETVDVSDNAYEDTGNILPRPFRLRFIPRNEVRKSKLIEEWEQALREGYYLGDVKVDALGMVVE
ncbi:uncharacterized protein A1O5_00911 [Cladophialophora psammophila CBS 110553]|uniref:Cytochrome P450 oxidoreductase n=1 Tax=Cladophialophora psammophila CBS 110553 TaxID=1182543 RepID=W9X881_9EURO|nr:uncharacterized protein A1O5_00911 [Cladophialophora psammophila CBS 110553]EXJ76403.1 hypothetical protein A1O5_00911 [Cladophialophora psammophila CBS 110553]